MIIKKKFINEPGNVVSEALNGLIFSNSNIQYHLNNSRIILRNDFETLKTEKKVTLLAGGGSGHEPFAAGYVGKNGLTAAVCGEIFTSPPSACILDAIYSIFNDAGTIVFVINYTGDCLNFGLAIERFKSQSLTKKIALIFIDDDIALESDTNNTTGNRGLAGAALVLHFAGVMADKFKKDFDEICNTSSCVIKNLGTFGVNFYPPALPGNAPMFDFEHDKVELGLGIHGEAGFKQTKLTSVHKLINEIFQKISASKRLHLQKNDSICLLINNLGSVSQIELNIVQNEALTWLISNNYNVECVITGSLMTSLDSYGLSFTVLKLVNKLWIKYLLDESEIAKNWKITIPQKQIIKMPMKKIKQKNFSKNCGVEIDDESALKIKNCLIKACEIILKNETVLNRLDNACGDGDCGSSLKNAATSIENAILQKSVNFNYPKIVFLKISEIFEEIVGGTSGALYAILFEAGAKSFEFSFTSNDIKNALKLSYDAIKYYGHAEPGYRTMIDSLHAAIVNSSNTWNEIVQKVEEAAKSTAQMKAKSGRASYTSTEHQKDVDPGAYAVALWFRAVYDCYFDKN